MYLQNSPASSVESIGIPSSPYVSGVRGNSASSCACTPCNSSASLSVRIGDVPENQTALENGQMKNKCESVSGVGRMSCSAD